MTTKRIAAITLPLRDNDGNQLKHTHQHLRDNLLKVWGGYTQSLVTGAWKDNDGTVYQDDSLKYEIAMTTGMGDGQALVAFATSVCVLARQQCVMVQLASGVVHFVKQNGELS